MKKIRWNFLFAILLMQLIGLVSFAQSSDSGVMDEVYRIYMNNIIQAEKQVDDFTSQNNITGAIGLSQKILKEAYLKKGVYFLSPRVNIIYVTLNYFNKGTKVKMDDITSYDNIPQNLKAEIIEATKSKVSPSYLELVTVLKRIQFKLYFLLRDAYLIGARSATLKMDVDFIKRGLAELVNIPVFVKDTTSGLMFCIYFEDINNSTTNHLLNREIISYMKANVGSLAIFLSPVNPIEAEIDHWKRQSGLIIKARLKAENSSAPYLERYVTP